MTSEPRVPTVADVVDVLESMYDPAWAREWDAVGLACGDRQAAVRRVLFAVDPVDLVVEEALAWHADLLITHHPLLLRPVHSVSCDSPKGQVLHRLIRGGTALYTAHTNADVAARGVSDALARVLGLTDLVPLEPDPPTPLDKIVVVVPAGDVEKVIDTVTAAGAGELGVETGAAYLGEVTGPPLVPEPLVATAEPGKDGRRLYRVEVATPRARRAAVLTALHAVRPATEVAVDVYELAGSSSPRGLGRVGRLATPTTLRDFALLVAEALPATAQGVRVCGEPTAEVSRVAVCGGAGDSLLAAVRACGADAYVTADLRHHPASEARQQSPAGPPYLIDVAHWASEWPWLAGAANRLQGELDAAGSPVEVHVSNKCTDPWTFRVPSPGGVVR